MHRIAFDETRDIAPIPFSEKILLAANQMKESGLAWHPHVGCFVWDRNNQISAPSPFPLNVYFILSIPRFTTIFGSIEKMQAELVWIPTWNQARQVLHQMALPDLVFLEMDCGNGHPEDELLLLYKHIAHVLGHQERKSIPV